MVDTEDIRKDAAPEEEVQETAAEPEEKEDAAQKKNDKSEEAAKKEPEEDSDTRYMRLMADFQNYKKKGRKGETRFIFLCQREAGNRASGRAG